MNRSVCICILSLVAVVGLTLAFAEDATAGHGHAGCTAAADYGCAASHGHAGWRPIRRLLGFERRQARRHARQAARYERYHAHGCGAPVGCAGAVEVPAECPTCPTVSTVAPQPQCVNGICTPTS